MFKSDTRQPNSFSRDYRDGLLKNKHDEEEGDGIMVISPTLARAAQKTDQYEQIANTSSSGEIESVPSVSLDHKSTFAQCVFNFSNVLMGVGLLGLPFALRSAGWIGGFLCLGAFGLITWRTSILIGRALNGDPRPASHFDDDSPSCDPPLKPGTCPEARMQERHTSLPEIAMTAFGDSGFYFLSAILYFELFACVAIFLVAIGDHLYELFPSVQPSIHTTMAAGVSLIPALLLRTPALLSYLSAFGTLSTVAVVVSVVAVACSEGDITERVTNRFHLDTDQPYHIYWNTAGLPLAFGLVAYCFSGHAIIPSIHTSMQRPQDFEKMVTVSYIIVMITCAAVAYGGYYMFGSTTLELITLSLKRSSKRERAMRALTWLMIFTGKLLIELLTPDCLLEPFYFIKLSPTAVTSQLFQRPQCSSFLWQPVWRSGLHPT